MIASTMISVPGNHQHHAALQGRGATQVSNYLNWSMPTDGLVLYQDMRATYRNGGTAAIIPTVPEKSVPDWLETVWDKAANALRRGDVWIICGYSAPSYDLEVMRLLTTAAADRPIKVLLMSPDSDTLQDRWRAIAPGAEIVALPGLPAGIQPLAAWLVSH